MRDGYKIALERIKECAETGNTTLNLGDLSLTEVPNEVWDLTHIEILNLGECYYDEEEKKWLSRSASNPLFINRITHIPPEIGKLTQLKELYLCGNIIEDFTFLKHIPQLQLLNLNHPNTFSSDLHEQIEKGGYHHLSKRKGYLTNLLFLSFIPNTIRLSIRNHPISDLSPLRELSSLQSLDFSETQVSDLSPLRELSSLQSLDFSSTQVSDLSPLRDLPSLQSLSFSSTQVSDLSPLRNLPSLQSLSFSSTQVSDLSPLENLNNLQSLNFAETQVQDLTPLKCLNNLQDLFFVNTQVSDITPLKKLHNLQELRLYNTQVKDLNPLQELHNIQELYLFNTLVDDITPLRGLDGLKTIYLNNLLKDLNVLRTIRNLEKVELGASNIHDLAPLQDLKNLQAIYFESTHVENLNMLKDLKNIQEIDLSRTKVRNLDILLSFPNLLELGARDIELDTFPQYLFELPHLMNLDISGNQLLDLPYEIVEDSQNCLEHARHWFADLEQGKAHNYEVKLILIGNGRVGKSSLLERLLHDTYTPNRASTHAIQLEQWTYPMQLDTDEGKKDVDLMINCWDFGGQDIYHATHRLFMQSRALYLVVWDWQTEQEKYAKPEEVEDEDIFIRNYPLPYWLHYVRTLSKRSPVIMVQNKVDLDKRKPVPNRSDMENVYSIQDFCHVSAESGRGIDDLREAIEEAFRTMPELGMEMPLPWYQVREKIKAIAEAEKDIPYERFIELCDEAEVREISRPSLLRYLHDTGILFYRENLFQDRIILDQQWAINAVYTLFDRNEIYYDYLKRGDGKFTLGNLQKIWRDYSKEECEVFVSFMESCEICFKVNENRTSDREKLEYIAPQLLPEDKPHRINRFWADHQDDTLHLIYKNDFLHYAIIQRFIVRAGHLAKEKDIWKYGISFSVLGADALIEVLEWEDKEVIHVQVAGTGRKDLLQKIKKEFKEIYYNEASVERFISIDGKAYVNFEEWEKNYNNDIEEMLAQNGNKIQVGDLKDFEEKEDWRMEREEEPKRLRDLRPITPAATKPLKFFISYAHEDEQYKDRLKDELLVLEISEIITVWNDRDLIPGKDVDEEIIAKQLEPAEVICMLISKSYLKSKYCLFEMKIAIEKAKNNTCCVIPIIVERVPNFDILPFSKIVSLPKDGYDNPVCLCEDQDAVWQEINEGITKLIEELRKQKA